MSSYTTTYDNLVLELQTYVEDDSPEYVASQNDIINRAEDRVVRDLNLELFKTEEPITITAANPIVTKPAGLLKLYRLRFTDTGDMTLPRSVDYCLMYDRTSQRPLYHAEEDETDIRLSPTPDQAYPTEIRFLRRPPPLGLSQQTNWLTDHVGDLLLLASLIESELYLIDSQRVQEDFLPEYERKLQVAIFELRGLSSSEYTPQRNAPQATGRPGE